MLEGEGIKNLGLVSEPVRRWGHSPIAGAHSAMTGPLLSFLLKLWAQDLPRAALSTGLKCKLAPARRASQLGLAAINVRLAASLKSAQDSALSGVLCPNGVTFGESRQQFPLMTGSSRCRMHITAPSVCSERVRCKAEMLSRESGARQKASPQASQLRLLLRTYKAGMVYVGKAR